ncbi:MAG: OmpA family protein [bacterium]
MKPELPHFHFSLPACVFALALVGCQAEAPKAVPKPEAPPPESLQSKLDKAVLGKTVEFDTDSAVLTKKGEALLDKVAELLVDSPDLQVEVQGHTDDVGGAAKNLDLSQRRAESVCDYLSLHAVGRSRLLAKGYGAAKPLAANDTEDHRSRNRRISFRVL